MTAKQTQSQSNSLNSANIAAFNEFANEFLTNRHNDEGETSDDYDSLDNNQENSAKNALFLEKYKQIKKIQIESSSNSKQAVSPSSSSPKKVLLEPPEENTTESSYENEYFGNNNFNVNVVEFNNPDENDEEDFDEDYEDDDEDEEYNDENTDYNNEENYDFNQFNRTNNNTAIANTSIEDNRSQTTELTLLKEDLINQSLSSIDNNNLEIDNASLKKKKRKSELILSTKLEDAEQQHQKSLSLSNQRSKKNKKSNHNLPLFKRDHSAPNSQIVRIFTQ